MTARPPTPTTAQVAAMIRNHKILRLRGIKATARNIMSPWRGDAVVELVDAELLALGATIEPKGHQDDA
ncbi:MAG: hypothetical protein ACRCSX_10445 [Allorhizobium sp.]